MKAAHLLLLLTIGVAGVRAQEAPYEIQIGRSIAERLLIHKVDPVFKNPAMAAKVTGTVVVDVEIDKNGDVDFAKVLSGPRMLRQPVLDAVRKYKYKPYLLKGKPVAVESTVPVTCSNE